MQQNNVAYNAHTDSGIETEYETHQYDVEVGDACGVQASCGRGLEDVGVPRGAGLGRKIEEKMVGC